MLRFNYFSFIKFFKNKELNKFYISVSIMTLAESLITIFVPVYLYQLNYPIHTIIFYFFLISLNFVIFAHFGAYIVSKIGIKHAILFSIPFLIIYYFGLKYLPAWPILFFILPTLKSWRRILYNYGYHLHFFLHSDKKLRGRQMSFLGAADIIMTVAAPLVSGLIIFYWGFSVIYIIGSILLILASVPLLLTLDKFEKIKFSITDLYNNIFNRKNFGLTLSFSGYANEATIDRVIWPVFLIILLLNTKTMGIIVTLSIVASIFVYYLAGQLTDKYNKIKLLKFGALLYSLGWLGRLFASSGLRIVLIDSYKNIAEKILHIPWGAYSYDLAQKTDYFEFIVRREIIFNLSRVMIMPLLILIFYINFNPFILSFIAAALFSLLYLTIINKKQYEN